jgi:hypothetical protein
MGNKGTEKRREELQKKKKKKMAKQKEGGNQSPTKYPPRSIHPSICPSRLAAK